MRVYYGSDGAGGWQPLDRPLRTITTLDRFGLVTWNGKTAMLRMLQVPELSRAMGFGGDFVLDAVRQRRDRIRILGNGVAPPEMQAIVETLTCPLY
jgi:DNA (cytosine-5)-methyltransferase 1